MSETNHIAKIGQTAGKIWQVLYEGGESNMTALRKAVGVPNDLLQQGLGWLAREGKLKVVKDKRSVRISLTEERP